mmetsp:Transcript_41083/g.118137  ORF Transcript_41083/g.118137 Transcript_41083/m.118137 type:complete len:561 (-) Transcript_41083:80-1762(-)
MDAGSFLPLRPHAQHFRRSGDTISIKPLSEEELGLVLAGEVLDSSNSVQFDTKPLVIVLDGGWLVIARRGAEAGAAVRPLIRMPIALSEASCLPADDCHVDLVQLRVSATADKPDSGGQRSTIIWLFSAEHIEAAHASLDRLGFAGAIRTDLNSVYTLSDKPMGSGTSADVYRGTSNDGRPSVAAKCFKIRRPDDQAAAAPPEEVPPEIRKEVELLAFAQGHPNIIRLFGLFRISGVEDAKASWCLTMELCAGDLYDRVKERRYSEAAARPVLKDILQGLSHIHGIGVLHRDMKVENVMMRADGTVVIADFGLSCSFDSNDELARACGSPDYIAPEVIMKFGAVEQSDVWGVGVMLYFMFSGKLPFRGPDVMTTLRRSVAAELNFDQHKAFGRISDGAKEYLRFMLARSPAERPCAEEAMEHVWMTFDHYRRPMLSEGKDGDAARDDDEKSEAAHSVGTSGSSVVSHARAFTNMSRVFRTGSRGATSTSRSRQVSVSSARSASVASGDEAHGAPRPPSEPVTESRSGRSWRYRQAAAASAGSRASSRTPSQAPEADAAGA